MLRWRFRLRASHCAWLRDGHVVWRAHYRTPAGTQRNKTFTRKIDAERFLATVENAKNTGTFVDPALSRITVGE